MKELLKEIDEKLKSFKYESPSDINVFSYTGPSACWDSLGYKYITYSVGVNTTEYLDTGKEEHIADDILKRVKLITDGLAYGESCRKPEGQPANRDSVQIIWRTYPRRLMDDEPDKIKVTWRVSVHKYKGITHA